MRARQPAALLLAGLLATACVHREMTGTPLEADSLGSPGRVLTRALSRVQALGYTLTEIDGENKRFTAEHSGTTFASFFGSDSNCALDVQTTPAARAHTSHIVVIWRARNVGSLAGCRKDAQATLRAGTGEEPVVERDRAQQPPLDPEEALKGGTYGGF